MLAIDSGAFMAKFFVGFFMIGNYHFKCNASSFGPPAVENS
jgi:hypothetical protein